MPGYLVTRWACSATDPLLGASVGVHYYFFMAPPPLPLITAVCQGALTIPHDLRFVYSAFAEVIFEQQMVFFLPEGKQFTLFRALLLSSEQETKT